MPDWLQRTVAIAASALALPVVALLAALIRLDSPGGAFFVSLRVGAGGTPFRLIKLRTMRAGAAIAGPGISVQDDPRVTRVGRVLRRTRLDELPQLWNVIRGDMLLVGPRPEDPRYVDLADPLHRKVFKGKPGITGLTQLAYAEEAGLLDPVDPEGQYRTTILPAKLALDARYLARRSVRLDSWILIQTLMTAVGRPPSRAAIADHAGEGQGVGDGDGLGDA